MAKSQKNQTIDLSRIDLGELDAGLDVNFLEYAITLPILKSLEGRTTSIIVGPKGSGKTGIRLKFAAGMPQHRTIKVSEEESMDFHDLSTSNPNEMRKKIEAYIIGLVYHWLSSHDNYDVSEFKTFADTPLFGFFKTLTKSTKVAPLPFITIALSDLFPPDKKTSVSYLLSSGFTDKLRRAIGTETLWILIDDIDAFVSTEQGAQRRVVLEQLLYAVSDLNLRSLKNSVWVVAFMKSEIFKEVRKVATEVDKAREYIEHISWSPDNLRAAVQERIEWNIKQQGLDISQHPWTEIFAEPSVAGINRFFGKLLSMAVNGPRNAIELMKRCLKNAVQNNDRKLSDKHIDNVVFHYGSEVLTDLASFYQHVYPNVDDLIDVLFREFNSEFTRSELEERIKKEFLHKAEVKTQLGEAWSVKCTAHKLVEIFDEIGVIGVWRTKTKSLVYSFEDRDAQFSPGEKLAVHPGLRVFLETG